MFILPIALLIVGLIIILLIPRKLNIKEIYVTWGIVALLTVLTDLIVGAVFDKFDYAGSKDIQLSDLFFEVTNTAIYGLILLSLMPKTNSRFLFYTIIWTILGLVIEWLHVKVGYLDYKGWSLWYSVPFYPATCYFLRWHLNFIREN